MHAYAAKGSPGIIMTAMREGRFYAVGVGCAMCENSDQEDVEIAAVLDLPAYADELWSVPSIQERKKNRKAFNRHWLGHMHVNWRCPQHQ